MPRNASPEYEASNQQGRQDSRPRKAERLMLRLQRELEANPELKGEKNALKKVPTHRFATYIRGGGHGRPRLCLTGKALRGDARDEEEP